MRLALTSIDSTCQIREFSCQFTTVKAALHFLNMTTIQGDTLLKACLIEAGIVVNLPVEAFDGNSSTKSIQALEKEWRQILMGSDEGVPSEGWYYEFTCQRVCHYDDKVLRLAETIRQLNRQLALLESTSWGVCNPNLIIHYERLLTSYEEIYRRAQAERFTWLERQAALSIMPK